MRLRHLELEPFSRGQKLQSGYGPLARCARRCPTLTSVGFRFGIRYGDFCGHRGFTHSLLFASILATLALVVGFPPALSGLNRAGLHYFVAAGSHGLLDALDTGVV